MRAIRWGIIGVGDVTEVKSGPAFQKANHSALVAVMRRTGALARDYAERHGVARWYDDADALIHDPDVNAVYIATPPDTHMDYALRVAQAGKPVYVEKPMARHHAECLRMIDACEQTGMPLFVAYYRRALPRFLKVKELVDSGAAGDVRYVSVTLTQRPGTYDPANLPWRVIPNIAGGGLFVDLASHTLDFLDFVLGPIRQAHGYAANQGWQYPAEDLVSGSFVFESGVQGVGTWCFTAAEEIDQVEIAGTRGKVVFSTFGHAPVRLVTSDGVQEFYIDHPPHIQQPLIQLVVDDLNGVGRCPSTGVTGARTSWVMDRLLGRDTP
jgi:predicted dehydrogenase